MRLRVHIEVDVSPTLAETIQRGGFSLSPDGTGMKMNVPHTPTIPKRKTKVKFVPNPSNDLEDVVAVSDPK